MESGTEARIRCVTKTKDKLWVQLYHDQSKFKYDIIRVLNDYVRNLKSHCDDVVIDKLDLKVDSFGSFVVDVPETRARFMEAVTKAAWKFERIDRGYAHPDYIFEHSVAVTEDEDCLKVMQGQKDTHTFLSAVIYYNHMPWSNQVRRIMKKVQCIRVKRYCKRTELMQKSSIGQSIGTRIGRIIGERFTEQSDNAFNKRIIKSIDKGMVRDEISILKGSGYLKKFDGRRLDLEEA